MQREHRFEARLKREFVRSVVDVDGEIARDKGGVGPHGPEGDEPLSTSERIDGISPASRRSRKTAIETRWGRPAAHQVDLEQQSAHVAGGERPELVAEGRAQFP
jgi:hypothetical protein